MGCCQARCWLVFWPLSLQPCECPVAAPRHPLLTRVVSKVGDLWGQPRRGTAVQLITGQRQLSSQCKVGHPLARRRSRIAARAGRRLDMRPVRCLPRRPALVRAAPGRLVRLAACCSLCCCHCRCLCCCRSRAELCAHAMKVSQRQQAYGSAAGHGSTAGALAGGMQGMPAWPARAGGSWHPRLCPPCPVCSALLHLAESRRGGRTWS